MSLMRRKIVSLFSFQRRKKIELNIFISQLGVVKNAQSKDCLVMGDFNLDINMSMRPDYSYKSTLNHLTEFANFNNLTQMVNFNTWSRIINGLKKTRFLKV